MLKLSEIQSFFPESLHRFPRFMLREYLQYKILDIIYDTEYANEFCFLGGTCLRIVHGNHRFSEDLDFDNTGLGEEQFANVADLIQKRLKREGYEIEIKMVMRGAWHCYIRFPGLLFGEGLSEYQEEKILIQLDAESQHFSFIPERVIVNRFEVFTTILTTPLPLLLAQKFYAIINRNRNKGRDFFDVVFLLGKGVQPDYNFLKAKASITNAQILKQRILEICQSLDMEVMARDVEPFLFDPKNRKKVIRFAEYFQQSF
ncbi:MAG: nucleotidyl transferase AbiEii/AbiGii toxin family protein [Candidatus Cloacimonetes bacterium]|nr:nucleotidyl transferase AbiEii/AbiGii toxin family protein [Candidatus Cloacimonadota bacterium]